MLRILLAEGVIHQITGGEWRKVTRRVLGLDTPLSIFGCLLVQSGLTLECLFLTGSLPHAVFNGDPIE
jgi:hypothetical protein